MKKTICLLLLLCLLLTPFEALAASSYSPGDAADKIDAVLSGSDYYMQVYRTSDGSTRGTGLCNVVSMTNLLNRKLALDGIYTPTSRFKLQDVMSAVECSDFTEYTIEGKPAYSYYGGTDYVSSASRSYTKGGKTYTVGKDYSYTGIALKNAASYFREMLKSHPEGLYVYAEYGYNHDHAILVTGSYDGTIYVIDPMNLSYTSSVTTYSCRLQDSWLYRKNSSATINYVDYLTQSSSPSSYIVNYDSLWTNDEPTAQTKSKGSSLTLSSYKPTLSGCTFLGWSETRGATTADYKAGGKYTADKSVTLYPVWKGENGAGVLLGSDRLTVTAGYTGTAALYCNCSSGKLSAACSDSGVASASVGDDCVYVSGLTPGKTNLTVTLRNSSGSYLDSARLTLTVVPENGRFDALRGASFYCKNGIIQTGWTYGDGNWYYCDVDGVMQCSCWKQSGGKWYYLTSDGTMAASQWVKTGGKWYYMDEDGVMTTGWQLIRGKWYHLSGSGAMDTGWLKSGGKWYYLGSDGAMCVGWKKVDGTWYYFNASGAMQTGWLKLSGKWYHLSGSGAMNVGWYVSGNATYYLNASGVMVTGLKEINGKTYFFNSSGAMCTGLKNIDGDFYYFGSDGAMRTGWVTTDGVWYVFNADGTMRTSAWTKSSGKWYYLGDDGVMVTDTTLTINGTDYTFDADGVWVA